MAARKRTSKILKYALPFNHRERIEELRGIAGTLPFHERYVAGEFQEVWAELRELGNDVLYDPVAIDAVAVAYETMHRVAANVDLIVQRLQSMGYDFLATAYSPYWRTSVADAATVDVFERSMQEMTEMANALGPLDIPPEMIALREQRIARERARSAAARDRRMGIVRPHVPPEPATDLQISRVTALAGEMPFSFRAWYETVGGVNLVGTHPELSPPGVQCDPLFVAPFQFVLDHCQAWGEDHAGEERVPAFQMPISPHRIAKAGVDPTSPLYCLTLPKCGLDAVLENEPHGLHFVDYLRLAFEWGGFPGYADMPERVPGIVAALKDSLLPI